MEKYEVYLVDEIPKDLEKRMQEGLVEYESTKGVDVNYKKFSLIIKNEMNVAVGVLNAFTAYSEVYIDDLWVDKLFRGKGYGRKLLKELENRFKGKGFNNINLVTSEFSAPGFYKKCGYEVEFIRENKKNPMLTKTFFVKYFDDDIQNQGIKNRQ